ncbi:MAG: alpha-L-fucosidase, partial [Clostridia bacterium]|nr:alpha-L-fucosidase [Clostridia bacterium]
CRKHDIKVGLYYSPAQAGYESSDTKDYDDYFIHQISELLSNYGKIDYLWFDGCGSEGHEYDTNRIVKAIRALQPHILIFNMWDPDTRWAGNEAGFVPLPNNNTVSALDFSVRTNEADEIENRFLPGECDCMIRDIWFYSDQNEDKLKSLDQLMGMYYCSVGYGANLLLNIAPDRRGILPESDVNRLLEFGEQVKKLYENPIEMTFDKQENTYIAKLDAPVLVNQIILSENLEESNKIEEFSIYVRTFPQGRQPILMYKGNTIGHKRICRFPTISTKEIEIVIDKESAPHKFENIQVFYVK